MRGGINTGALITISAIAAIILFIALLRATVTISYSDEVKLFVRVLIFKINILPKKEKKGPSSMSAKKAAKIRAKLRKKSEKKRMSAEEKKRAKAEKKTKQDKKSLAQTISDVRMFAGLGVLVIQKFFRHLRIRLARIRITVATDDAATTAVAYGAITQSINILFPALESVKNFQDLKNTDIDIKADFTKTSPEIDVKLSFSIRVWQVFDIAISALKTFIKHKLKAMSQDNINSGHIPQTIKAQQENNKIYNKK